MLRYLRSKSNLKRDTIDLSMSCYGLKMRSLLTVSRIRRTWRIIPIEEDMDDVNIYNDRECHWRTVFENNYGGVDDAKALLHTKR